MKQKQARAMFDEIFKKHFQETFAYILGKTGDINVTPQILEKSFTELYQKLKRTQESRIENQRTFLFKIVQKHISTYYKKLNESIPNTGRKIKKYEKLLAEEHEAELTNLTKSAAIQNIKAILPHVATHHLKKRRAFILYYLFGFDLTKTAAELDISESDAGNYIYQLTKEIHEAIINNSLTV